MERLAIINKDTGEIVEENVLLIGRKAKYIDKGYIKVFTAFLSDLVENDEIAGKSIRLLFYMLERLNFNDYTIYISPKEAINHLKISEKTYHNWIRTLIKHQIIEKVNPYTYKLKPYTAVKGTTTQAIENELKDVANTKVKKEIKSQSEPKTLEEQLRILRNKELIKELIDTNVNRNKSKRKKKKKKKKK